MGSFQVYAEAFGIAFITTILSTPIASRIALRFNFVDSPNSRKVHHKKMPRLGGLSIVAGFTAGLLYLSPYMSISPSFYAGAFIIVFAGILDDRFSLPAKYKLAAQLAAAVVFVTFGPHIEHVNIPYVGFIQFGWMSYIITVLWIVTVTNAINLIDGLDGLAAGVSSIALSSLLIMAILNQQASVIVLTTVLLGGTLGFLMFNFHPAKIFMGDSGSMFIGYTISIISIAGLFKSLTLFSLLLPIMVLAVPIFDIFFAVIRRLLNKQKLSTPDKKHLHHRLMTFGFSHKKTVLIIYAISISFSGSAVILSKSFMWGSLLIIFLSVAMMQFFIEVIDVLSKRPRPILDRIKKLMAVTEASKK